MTRHPALVGGVLLALFGVLGAFLVALTHEVTADRIARNERETLLSQIRLLIPQDQFNNDLLTDTLEVNAPEALGTPQTTVYRARQSGQPVAVILSPVVAKGYNGNIKLIIGVMADQQLAGVRVLAHRETPGLGDKIELDRSDWMLGFARLSLHDPSEEQWKVKRDGGYFDQFTGATITPRAIVKAVKEALLYVNEHQQRLYQQDTVEQ